MNKAYSIRGDLGESCTIIRETSLNPIKKNPKSSILITSIIPKISTIDEILQKSVDYNDDMFIFEIKGQTSLSTCSWKIYKNNNQIKELFDEILKDLSKREFIDKNLVIKCKMVYKYTNNEIIKNINKISDLLMNIFNNTIPEQPQVLLEALKISKASFLDNSEIKPFEGYALKEDDELTTFKKIFKVFFGWEKRWLILKNDNICYLKSPNDLVGENVFWFDQNIEISSERKQIIKITNLSKCLYLKFSSPFERDLWKKEIECKIEQKKEDMMTYNIYNSFTSQKMNCGAKWFVDGKDYFMYLFEQLKSAKESVYITDWFLSPELALRRPINYDIFADKKKNYKENLNFSNASRLMDIFYLLAKKGVKIYILLFCEMKIALALNSLYTKNTLKKLHKNIMVTRHPKGTTSVLWSHHEKLVIIDQKIAFVGGLDLCWGRYDRREHPIVEEENPNHLYEYPGSDYINERQVDLHEVEKFYVEQINRNEKPRMAWHDVHTMVEGPIVSDFVRHFVERWNYARFNKGNNKLVNVNSSKKFDDKDNVKKNKIKDNFEEELNRVMSNSNENRMSTRITQTLKSKDIILLNKMSENLKCITEENNESDDDEIIKKKLKRNSFKQNKLKDSEDNSLELNIKKKKSGSISIKNLENNDYKIMNNLEINKDLQIKEKSFLDKDSEIKDNTIKMNFKIQALRSVSNWSIGKEMTERSILQGYYKLIDNAKHYIYIENQFFITKSFSEQERLDSGLRLNDLVQNEIGLHIRTRIERAYEEKADFKVFICIPLLPGFTGTPGESSTVNCILKHTYQSIAHNKGMSLLELLRKKMGNAVNKYIYFFSLRNHGIIKDIPVTELIYIHSKLLIVDDEKVLIGSANINERSMDGSRDSEFAVIIEEEKTCDSIMNNVKFTGSQYAISLRKRLMAEHLGLKEDDKILIDPLNNALWKEMRARAEVNSTIYSNIFDCFPDNRFNNFAKLKERKKIKTKEDIEKLKKEYNDYAQGIQGHIVEYPIQFLKDEELDIDFFSKENIIPEKSYI